MPPTQRVDVHYLPQFVAEHQLADAAVVVIDQLRASSTICYALAAGAREVMPLLEVDAVLEESQRYQQGEILLGGERGGMKLEGFDLGNSPSEYTADVVFGKRILFTTSNGTRAIEHGRLASRLVMGCAANASAVARSLAEEPEVHILCAGTNGHVSRDDLLIAGLLIERLMPKAHGGLQLNEGAESTLGEWLELVALASANNRSVNDQLALELRDTPGGKNLIDVGHADDLVDCAQIDAVEVVPELDRDSGCLKVSDVGM